MKYRRYTVFLLILVFLMCISVTAYDRSIIYKNVDNPEMKIALSFDDGPHPTHTCEIIEILNKHGVKGTFFVVGKNVVNYPDVLRQIVDNGHEVANHSFSHTITKNSTKDAILKEMRFTHDAILNVCETEVRFFRPPGGSISADMVDAAKSMNYNIILWNIDTRDWAHTDKSTIIKNVLSNIKSGSIILFHDYISGKTPTPQTIDELIPLLLEQGYSLVTLQELMESSSEKLMPVS